MVARSSNAIDLPVVDGREIVQVSQLSPDIEILEMRFWERKPAGLSPAGCAKFWA